MNCSSKCIGTEVSRCHVLFDNISHCESKRTNVVKYILTILNYYKSMNIPALVAGGFSAYMDNRTPRYFNIDLFVARSRMWISNSELLFGLLNYLRQRHSGMKYNFFDTHVNVIEYNGKPYQILSFLVYEDEHTFVFKIHYGIFSLPLFPLLQDETENYNRCLNWFARSVLSFVDLSICRIAMVSYAGSNTITFVRNEHDSAETWTRELEDIVFDEHVSERTKNRAIRFLRRINCCPF